MLSPSPWRSDWIDGTYCGREDSRKTMQPSGFMPLRYVAAAVAYCGFIYYLSSRSSFPFEAPFPLFDKIVHVCLFGGLSATVALGLHRARREYSAVVLVIVPAAFSTLYGLTDEAHQLFVASRTFAVGDLIADAFGSTVAAALVLPIERHRRTTESFGETHRR